MTATTIRAAWLAAVAGLLAVVFGLPELAILAAPFLVSLPRQRKGPRADESVARSSFTPAWVAAGSIVHLGVQASVPSDVAVAVVTVQLAGRHGGRQIRVVTVPQELTVRATIPVHAEDRGRLTMTECRVDGYTAEAVHRSHARGGSRSCGVLPAWVEARNHGNEHPFVRSVYGVHRSRWTGAGEDFAGLREFRRGDSARDINWQATARMQTPLVNAFRLERGADLLVVVGGHSATFDYQDQLVGLAGGHCMQAMRRGDRVQLLELARASRTSRPISGVAHHLEVLQWLADAHAGAAEVPAALHERLPLMIDPRAGVLILDSLLHAEALLLAARIRQQGHVVTYEDPEPMLQPVPGHDADTDLDRLSRRLRDARRRYQSSRLTAIGVQVVSPVASPIAEPVAPR